MILNISDENKTKYGIYAIRCIVNNGVYVGQTTEGFYNRWVRHSYMLNNNKHFNIHLQQAYNKYGAENFEMTILEICNDASQISALEEKYISEYRSRFRCYNILAGGVSMKGENNPFFGKKHTSETRKELSACHTGKHVGEKNNFYGADHSGSNNGFYGHKHTEESRRKMSEAKSILYKGKNNPFFGKQHTKETIEKIKRNRKNATSKVLCIETGIVYNSINEAAKETNTCAKSISAVCSGHRKTANNLHWRYISVRGKLLCG